MGSSVRLLGLLVGLAGCSTGRDVGMLCTDGDDLRVVFETCRSSSSTVLTESCEVEMDGTTAVVSTRYRTRVPRAQTPDCQEDVVDCALPSVPEEVVFGEASVAFDELPTFTSILGG